jgi:hypothetical protein
MIQLKKGIFALSFKEIIINIGKRLIAADSGKLWISNNEISFEELQVEDFGSSNINDILYAEDISQPENKIFFAAADSGKLLSSTNLTTWTSINTGITNDISKINYGGSNDFIPAGVVWTTIAFPFTLSHVAYGNGTWVAVSHPTEMFNSTDLISWSAVNSNFGNTITRVSYGNGSWVAVGHSGQLRSSTDTITWTTANSNFGNINIDQVVYGNGVWVIQGSSNSRYSTDGSTWITNNLTLNWPIFFGGGAWYSLQQGINTTTLFSDNGIYWEAKNLPLSQNHSRIMAYGNGLWMFGGRFCSIQRTNDITNPNNWRWGVSGLEVFGFDSNFSGLAYGDGIWIATGGYGGGQFQISTDGQNWRPPVRQTTGRSSILGYGNSTWIIAGNGIFNVSTRVYKDYKSYFVAGKQ